MIECARCRLLEAEVDRLERMAQERATEAHDLAVQLAAYGSVGPEAASAWPPRDVVQQLADSVRHLLNDHDCDCPRHEDTQLVERLARGWLATRQAVQATNPDNPITAIQVDLDARLNAISDLWGLPPAAREAIARAEVQITTVAGEMAARIAQLEAKVACATCGERPALGRQQVSDMAFKPVCGWCSAPGQDLLALDSDEIIAPGDKANLLTPLGVPDLFVTLLGALSRRRHRHDGGDGQAPRPLVAVVLVERDGRFLALRKKSFGGKVALPGGKIKVGESPVEAAFREVLEETGLRVWGLTPITTALSKGFPCVVFTADGVVGELASGEEGEAFWATREEIVANRYSELPVKTFLAYDDRAKEERLWSEIESLREFLEDMSERKPAPPPPPDVVMMSSCGSFGAGMLHGQVKRLAGEALDASIARLPKRISQPTK